jgi:hypothetical protein
MMGGAPTKPLIGIAVASCLILLWWFWPAKVELSDSEYEVAIALYRVCNQMNDDGLVRIENLLAETKGSEFDQQVSPLQSILDLAKLGRWKEASEACRLVLDDQVTM